jgi:hypothetical protein
MVSLKNKNMKGSDYMVYQYGSFEPALGLCYSTESPFKKSIMSPPYELSR